MFVNTFIKELHSNLLWVLGNKLALIRFHLFEVGIELRVDKKYKMLTIIIIIIKLTIIFIPIKNQYVELFYILIFYRYKN